MPWVKLDEKIRHHPKFLRAGPAASWLFVCGLSYCNEHLTDGFIPDEALRWLGVPPTFKPASLAQRLCKAGLWTRQGEGNDDARRGYAVHNYHDYQPTREHVEHVRSIRQQSGKAGGIRSGEARHLQANGKQIASTMFEAKSNPVPSRPDGRSKEQISRPGRFAESVVDCQHSPPCSSARIHATALALGRMS